MINLLPASHAEAIRFGRQNTKLRNWLLGLIGAIIVLVLIVAGGWLYLNKQQHNYKSQIASTNQQLKTQNLSQTQKDAKEITGDIKVINQVLGTEVKFSDLIQAIGNDIPSGTVLSSLTLSNKVAGALDLSANTINYASAAQVAVNLSQAQNNLFSNVDIISISCGGGQANQTYKCTAIYRALFSKTAQTKFLSVAKGS
jgi:Tfp pilus assembly protein PilN